MKTQEIKNELNKMMKGIYEVKKSFEKLSLSEFSLLMKKYNAEDENHLAKIIHFQSI